MIQILSQVSALIIVPILALLWLAKVRNNHVALIAQTIAAIGYFAFILSTAPWGFVWYPLRAIFFAALVLVVVNIIRYLIRTPWTYPDTRAASVKALMWAFAGFLTWCLMIPVAVGWRAPGNTVQLSFPLSDGVFVVGHGGGSNFLNYHYPHFSQRYALDVLQLNSVGLRAWGVYPTQLDRYAIYGTRVISPCTGEVVKVEDGHPDLLPPQRDSANPAGNYVAIECQGVTVYLAHLQPDKLSVMENDLVSVGDTIGLVGNSGNTTEPHLHIHAEEGPFANQISGRKGIPIRFDGRYLVRNNLMRH